MHNQTGALITLSIACPNAIGCKGSKLYTWDAPTLFNCSLIREEWQTYFEARHALYDAYVANKSRILSLFQSFVFFFPFLICGFKSSKQL